MSFPVVTAWLVIVAVFVTVIVKVLAVTLAMVKVPFMRGNGSWSITTTSALASRCPVIVRVTVVPL